MNAIPTEKFEQAAKVVAAMRDQIGRAFVGQTEVVEQVLAALLAAGHVLIEGVPGLGKTLLVLFVNGYGTVAVVDGDGLKIPVTPVLRGTEVGFGLMPVPAGEVPFGRGKGTLGVKDPVITDVPGVEVTPCEVGEQ